MFFNGFEAKRQTEQYELSREGMAFSSNGAGLAAAGTKAFPNKGKQCICSHRRRLILIWSSNEGPAGDAGTGRTFPKLQESHFHLVTIFQVICECFPPIIRRSVQNTRKETGI
ncbi:hypothetical protein WMY93_017137 [Mugilogobius chulae]|uniref:Uncharacterized protein n=1 Tax=Mugilogobius chulae TaxID=88201 RepID=A0AAW0NMC8_9GOBI